MTRRENLSTSEADALVRLLRLRDLAQETFGDPSKAARWLARASSLLAGAVPADLLNTELGGRRVEEAMARLDTLPVADDSCRELRQRWLTEMTTSLLLRVPSMLMPAAHDVLPNPAHPDHQQLRITEQIKWPFAARLVRG